MKSILVRLKIVSSKQGKILEKQKGEIENCLIHLLLLTKNPQTLLRNHWISEIYPKLHKSLKSFYKEDILPKKLEVYLMSILVGLKISGINKKLQKEGFEKIENLSDAFQLKVLKLIRNLTNLYSRNQFSKEEIKEILEIIF